MKINYKGKKLEVGKKYRYIKQMFRGKKLDLTLKLKLEDYPDSETCYDNMHYGFVFDVVGVNMKVNQKERKYMKTMRITLPDAFEHIIDEKEE